MGERPTVVISARWHQRTSEAAFVVRSLAGAASRHGPVSVLVTGEAGGPDGAFDLGSLGRPPRWPAECPPDGAVIVDELTPDIASLLRDASVRPPPVWFLAAAGGAPDPGWHPLPVAGDGSVGVYVPVNPMAERHRHHGFGFTGYLLVLSGRAAAEDEPPPEVAWLSAAFTDEHVVLVEQAAASAWRARALRGRVSVDTRMDLWRLLAHAAVCVDLGPGGLVARECIEALRLGTPVVAPAGGAPVAALAAAGAAVTYGDAGELVDAVGALRDAPTRQAASERGRRHADAQHGDPARSVERLGQLLGGA
jgi:glycosyltransferase involved in cell wall biosynthesis